MINKTLRANIAVGLLGLILTGFSGTLLFNEGADLVQVLFHPAREVSVAELIMAETTQAVSVAGFVGAPALVEATSARGSSEVAWHRYYYPVFERTRTIGFYVYSEQPPEAFLKTFGTGQARFVGIWEETPGDVRQQETLSHAREFEIAAMKPGLTTQDDPVVQVLRGHPLRSDRRLNLRIDFWQTEKFALLAGTFVFFVIGLGMVWAALRRHIQPV